MLACALLGLQENQTSLYADRRSRVRSSSRVSDAAGVGTIRVPNLSTVPLVSTNSTQVDLRTGDYSTAALDEQGNAWLVAEYASSHNGTAFSPTNAADHTLNWGTWIMHVSTASP